MLMFGSVEKIWPLPLWSLYSSESSGGGGKGSMKKSLK